jgi:hypothetical protein
MLKGNIILRIKYITMSFEKKRKKKVSGSEVWFESGATKLILKEIMEKNRMKNHLGAGKQLSIIFILLTFHIIILTTFK